MARFGQVLWCFGVLGCAPTLDFGPADGLPADATIDARRLDARMTDMRIMDARTRDASRMRDVQTTDMAVQIDARLASDAAMVPDARLDQAPDARRPDQAIDATLPAAEVCDGQDNDGDGQADEGAVCADYVVQNCRFSLGLTTDVTVAEQPTHDFAPCVDGIATDGNRRCVWTQPPQPASADPPIALVRWDGIVPPPSALLLRFRCAGSSPEMNRWTEEHCAMSLAAAHEDAAVGEESIRAVEPDCPAAWARNLAGNPRCIRSGDTRQHHPLWVDWLMDSDNFLGVAWRCRADGQFQAAAEGLQRHVQAVLTVHTPPHPDRAGCIAALDTSPVGDAPCGFLEDWNLRRCARSPADGSFEPLNFPPPQQCMAIGIGLRRRPN